jgi:hypothetical protein
VAEIVGRLEVVETDDWYEVCDDEGVHAKFIDAQDARDFIYMKEHNE